MINLVIRNETWYEKQLKQRYVINTNFQRSKNFVFLSFANFSQFREKLELSFGQNLVKKKGIEKEVFQKGLYSIVNTPHTTSSTNDGTEMQQLQIVLFNLLHSASLTNLNV
mgnify:CR=1 FL=1